MVLRGHPQPIHLLSVQEVTRASTALVQALPLKTQCLARLTVSPKAISAVSSFIGS
jgi:hypothetical protein